MSRICDGTSDANREARAVGLGKTVNSRVPNRRFFQSARCGAVRVCKSDFLTNSSGEICCVRSVSTTTNGTLTSDDILVNVDIIACFTSEQQGILATTSSWAGGRMSLIEQSRSDLLSFDLTTFVRRFPIKGMVLPFRQGLCFVPLCGAVPKSWLSSHPYVC